MGTKAQPGQFDCYAAALPDEPMFILLARDPLAPLLTGLWAAIRAGDGVEASTMVTALFREKVRYQDDPEPEKAAEAYECAIAMQTWRRQNDGAWRDQQSDPSAFGAAEAAPDTEDDGFRTVHPACGQPEDATARRLTRVLVDRLGVTEADITPDVLLVPAHDERGRKLGTDVRDLGCDSLDVVEIAMAIEEEFKIEIPDDQVGPLNTANFGQLVNFVQARLEVGA
ncbi:MAG: acyl carrier protein [Bacillota bacterium]